MNFKETYLLLQNLRYYITEPRFKEICRIADLQWSEKKIRDVFQKLGKSWHSFIASEFFDEKMLNALLEYKATIDISEKHYSTLRCNSDKHFCLEKVIYERAGETIQEEISLHDYDGLLRLTKIYETADVFLGRMKFACEIGYNDEVDGSRKSVNVFIGDFFNVSKEFSDKGGVYIACEDSKYNDRWTFRELLYTDKYGYLTANGDPHEDDGTVDLNIDMSNAYSTHVVSSGQRYIPMGNILTDVHMLRNPKKAEQ